MTARTRQELAARSEALRELLERLGPQAADPDKADGIQAAMSAAAQLRQEADYLAAGAPDPTVVLKACIQGLHDVYGLIGGTA